MLKHIYMMLALWNPDDMCHEVWEPVFIYTAKMLDSSTGLSVGALLKSKQSDLIIRHLILKFYTFWAEIYDLYVSILVCTHAWYINMYERMFVDKHECLTVCIKHTRLSMYVCINAYVRIHAYLDMFVCSHTFINVYVCMYISMSQTCMSACMYVCM